MLWVTGSNDFAYTFNALQSSYRLPQGPRTLCVRLRMPHAHGGAGENPKEIHVFADRILKGTVGLPIITDSRREGTEVHATFTTTIPVVRAELNYTKDGGRWQDRKWESIPANHNDKSAADLTARVTASLPEGTRAYYFNFFDQRGCVVSTEHELVDQLGPAR